MMTMPIQPGRPAPDRGDDIHPNSGIVRRFFLHACAAAQGARIPYRKSLIVPVSSLPVLAANIPQNASARVNDTRMAGKQNDRAQQLAAVERELYAVEQRYAALSSKPEADRGQLQRIRIMLASLRSLVEQFKANQETI